MIMLDRSGSLSLTVATGVAAVSAIVSVLWFHSSSDGARAGISSNPRSPPSWTHEEKALMAAAVGVNPPAQVPRRWLPLISKSFRWTLRFCHALDPLPNSFLCLQCLWWKAIAANDANSPAYDHGLMYDMLPSYSRIIVSEPLVRFWPRLLHANVEIRTAFLDRAIRRIKTATPKRTKLLLVTLGGGYDIRSIKMMQLGLVYRAAELDLPEVVQAKQALLEKRFHKRRPQLQLPLLVESDLNQVDSVEQTLRNQVLSQSDEPMVTIFLFEAVFLYLEKGVPTALLKMCSRMARPGDWLILVDRIEGVTADNKEEVARVLRECQWELMEFLPKAGATRHMVRARLLVE